MMVPRQSKGSASDSTFNDSESEFATSQPAQVEIDAWAEREHKRRQAWLNGPGVVERLDWAERHCRDIDATGGIDIEAEAEAWKEREHKRRQAWLNGPSEQERLEWARQHRRRSMGGPVVAPTDDEVAAWAEHEGRRRRAWAEGPTEQEKIEWAREHSRSAGTSIPPWSAFRASTFGEIPFDEAEELLGRWARQAELASKGLVYSLIETPLYFWSQWLDAGRRWEEGSYRPYRRARVRFYD